MCKENSLNTNSKFAKRKKYFRPIEQNHRSVLHRAELAPLSEGKICHILAGTRTNRDTRNLSRPSGGGGVMLQQQSRLLCSPSNILLGKVQLLMYVSHQSIYFISQFF